MTIKIQHDFGDIVYIKNDPDQNEYEIVGFWVRPGAIVLELDRLGETIDVYEFQISTDRDMKKVLGLDKKREEEEEDE